MAVLSIAAVVAAVAVIVLAGGNGDGYRMRVELANAGGLREGSTVRVGGASVGKVTDLRLGRGDRAIADVELEDAAAPVGAGASAAVRSLNLLGQKYLDLDAGDRSRPQPSGSVIPRDRATIAVELDQVLDVLDPDTRARLAIVINEMGLSMTRRPSDYNAMLRRLPPTLSAATRMVGEVAADNRALGRLVERGDRLMARIATERRQLGRLVGVSASTMRNLASRRDRMGEALDRAPGTLTSLRGFLAELRSATRPLGPAATSLKAAAPSLVRTLTALAPFERTARPALDQASSVAPKLTRLVDDALPVVRQGEPTARSLAELSETLPPLSSTLRRSVDDLLGGVEGMARSTQEQDNAGHYWRAAGIVSTEQIEGIVGQLLKEMAPKRGKGSRPATQRRPASREDRSGDRAPKRSEELPRRGNPIDEVRSTVPKVLEALPDKILPKNLLETPSKLLAPQRERDRDRDHDLEPLLDFLLG